MKLTRLFTDDGIERLYRHRRESNPTEGHRNRRSVTLLLLLLGVVLSALFSFVWVERGEKRFLAAQNGVALLRNDAMRLTIARVAAPDCKDPAVCYASLKAATPFYWGLDLLRFDLGDAKRTGVLRADDVLMISGVLPAAAWESVHPRVERTAYVLGLPMMRYAEAWGYVDGRLTRTFQAGEPLGLGFLRAPGESGEVRFDLVVRPEGGAPELLQVTPSSYLVFVAEQLTWQRYLDHQAVQRVGGGKQLADLARIVLAIFSLLLFLLVDSSPEALGLAIFMAFKAIGVILGQNWLPHGILPPEYGQDVRWFALCFGDVMQVYFFSQLTRLTRPTLWPWVVYGGALSALYAVILHFDSRALDVDWNMEVWRWRNVLAGGACVVMAAAATAYCLRRKLRLRATAMVVAAAGTVVQIVYPIVHMFPPLFHTDAFQTFYGLFETYTPYVFALAAFINISALEGRVRAMQRELAAVRGNEAERALGDALRGAMPRMPHRPAGLRLASHRAKSDTLDREVTFARYDEGERMLWLVACDLGEGAGLAAGVKAVGAAAIAAALWDEGGARGDATSDRATSARSSANGEAPTDRAADARGSAGFDGATAAHLSAAFDRGPLFDERLRAFVAAAGYDASTLATSIATIDLARRTLRVHCAGGRVPLIVAPEPGGPWSVRHAPVEGELPPGAFVVVRGAGFPDDLAAVEALRRRLCDVGPQLDEVLLKEAVLAGAAETGALDVLVYLDDATERSRSTTAKPFGSSKGRAAS